MCEWSKHGDTRIDPCMREFVKWLGNKHTTILSCCGHGKYPMSVIVKEYETVGIKRFIIFKEIFSGIVLRVKEDPLKPDPKKFYKRDKEGYYYIPEVSKESKEEMCKCGHTKDEHKSSFYNYKGLKMIAQECGVKGCKCKKFVKAKKGVQK